MDDATAQALVLMLGAIRLELHSISLKLDDPNPDASETTHSRKATAERRAQNLAERAIAEIRPTATT